VKIIKIFVIVYCISMSSNGALAESPSIFLRSWSCQAESSSILRELARQIAPYETEPGLMRALGNILRWLQGEEPVKGSVPKLVPRERNTGDDRDRTKELVEAAKKGDLAVVKMLLDKGADPKSKEKDGATSLMYAAVEGHLAVARLLLDKGADVNARDSAGWSPLIGATLGNRLAVAELLLEEGADINAKENVYGWSALIHAVVKGNSQIIGLLLDKGADVDAMGKDGMTSLMYSALKGDLEAVKMLAAKGADSQLKDRGGLTALDYASRKGHTSVAEFLRTYRADSGPTPYQGIYSGQTPPSQEPYKSSSSDDFRTRCCRCCMYESKTARDISRMYGPEADLAKCYALPKANCEMRGWECRGEAPCN
jgi:hypothetical protein